MSQESVAPTRPRCVACLASRIEMGSIGCCAADRSGAITASSSIVGARTLARTWLSATAALAGSRNPVLPPSRGWVRVSPGVCSVSETHSLKRWIVRADFGWRSTLWSAKFQKVGARKRAAAQPPQLFAPVLLNQNFCIRRVPQSHPFRALRSSPCPLKQLTRCRTPASAKRATAEHDPVHPCPRYLASLSRGVQSRQASTSSAESSKRKRNGEHHEFNPRHRFYQQQGPIRSEDPRSAFDFAGPIERKKLGSRC